MKTSTFLSKTCQSQFSSLSASPASLRSLWCKEKNSFPCWVQFSLCIPQIPQVCPFNHVSFSVFPGPQLETSFVSILCKLGCNCQMYSWHSSMAWWYRSGTRCCDTWRTSEGVNGSWDLNTQAQSDQSPLPQFHTKNADCLLLDQLVLRGFYAGMSMHRDFKAFVGTKVNALLSRDQLYSAWSVVHLLRTLLFWSWWPPVISYKHSYWFFQTQGCSTGNQKIRLRWDWLGHLPHFQAAVRFHFVD